MNHAFRLGLRNPSEPTYASLTAFLCIFQPAKTGFGLAQTHETTKSTWQSFKKKRKNRIQAGDLHLVELPAAGDLPDVVKMSAFGEQPRVECRIKDSSLQDLEDKIVMRKSNLLSPNNPVAQLGGLSGGMSSQLVSSDANAREPLLNQLIQVLVLLAKPRSDEQEMPIHFLKTSPSASSLMSSASAGSTQKALPAPAVTDAGKTQPSMPVSVDPGLDMSSQLIRDPIQQPDAVPEEAEGSDTERIEPEAPKQSTERT